MDVAVHPNEDYLADISTWMKKNRLKLNENIIELINRFFRYSSRHLWNRLPEEIKRAVSQQAFL